MAGMKLHEWQEKTFVEKGSRRIDAMVKRKLDGRKMEELSDSERSDLNKEMDEVAEDMLDWFLKGRRTIGGPKDPRDKRYAEQMQAARELVYAIEKEIRAGVKHYGSDGKRLVSIRSILHQINQEGKIFVDVVSQSHIQLTKFNVRVETYATATNNKG